MNEANRLARALRLQAHLASERLTLSGDAARVFERIKARLNDGWDSERLHSTQAEISGLVKMSRDRTVITCGPARRNFARDSTHDSIHRVDGASFDFALTLAPRGRDAVELVAYDYEIRFPTDAPRFVRFDLNPPTHANADDGLRSHVHVGTDDDGMAAPCPCLTPDEALDLLIFGLTRTGRTRHVRAKGP